MFSSRNEPHRSFQVVVTFARLADCIAPSHLGKLWMLGITEDLEINRLSFIAVERVVDRLFGQADDSSAQPAEKRSRHAAVSRLLHSLGI